MGRLDGKRIWVTGASRGIGAAIARGCAAEGARVVVTSRKLPGVEACAAAINADHPGSTVARACHAGNIEQIGEAVDWIRGELGDLDVLVNNAAVNPHFGPLLGATDGAWDKTFEVNVRGAFEATRRVVQGWLDMKRGGSVVNVASIQGFRASPLQGVYGMTKAAVISMTRTLAMELGRSGIRVNAIAPGLVETHFASILTATPEISKAYTDRAALGRWGQPEEIAGVAVHLASDESSYCTGQVFTVDGGYTAT